MNLCSVKAITGILAYNLTTVNLSRFQLSFGQIIQSTSKANTAEINTKANEQKT